MKRQMAEHDHDRVGIVFGVSSLAMPLCQGEAAKSRDELCPITLQAIQTLAKIEPKERIVRIVSAWVIGLNRRSVRG